jgi:hypothetical protein
MERLIGVFFIPPVPPLHEMQEKMEMGIFPCFGLLITGDHATISFWLFVCRVTPKSRRWRSRRIFRLFGGWGW